jgi:hypothetical protein
VCHAPPRRSSGLRDRGGGGVGWVGDSAFRTDVFRTCASEGTEGRVERRTSDGRGRGGEGRQGRERRGGREERAGSGWGGGERRRERDRRPLTPVLSEGKKYLLYHCWQSVEAATPLPYRKKKWSVKDWYFGVGITNFYRV